MRAKPPESIFGQRLREARERVGLPQDRLGVEIGLDEGTASARISRYETGAHEPPFQTAVLLAKALKVPVPFLYCKDDELAQLLLTWQKLPKADRRRAKALVESLLD